MLLHQLAVGMKQQLYTQVLVLLVKGPQKFDPSVKSTARTSLLFFGQSKHLKGTASLTATKSFRLPSLSYRW
jgi:hypothetical protein